MDPIGFFWLRRSPANHLALLLGGAVRLRGQTHMRKSIPAFLAVAGLSIVALTGCGAGEQSVADACKIANETLASVQTEVTEAATKAQTGDLGALTDAFELLGDKFDEAVGKISNAEVKAPLETAGKAMDSAAEAFASAGDDPMAAMEGMQEMGTDLQEAGTKLGELCG